MTFILVSCYLSHHQLPLCLELHRRLGDAFRFIASEEPKEERLLLGYQNLNNDYPFVLKAYESDALKEEARALTDQADVVMLGSAPFEYIHRRLQNGKLTFLYSERLYKKSVQPWKLPVRMLRFYQKYGQYRNFYLLCASAYTAGDFSKTLTFLNKAYKWGYFPEVKKYDDFEALMTQKKPNSITWAGRFIDWKHPELVIEVARRLKADGYDFHINMLGNGNMHETISQMVQEHGLQEQVCLTGAMSPEEVRQYMEQAEIHLFTSDRGEGWGAVANEAMNSGCAIVASHAIGSVPFLVNDKENGLIYKDGNVDDLYNKVKFLLDNPEKRLAIGTAAYETMTQQWNAKNAASRLIALAETICAGNKNPELFTDGVCSKAPLLKDNWCKG